MSENLTQMLERNPKTSGQLTRVDALRLLFAGGTGTGKDAMVLLTELAAAFHSFHAQDNDSGEAEVIPGILAMHHLEVIDFGGAGSTTRPVVLDADPEPIDGARLVIRMNLPTTSGITITFHSGDAGNPELTSLVTDTSGDDKVIEFYAESGEWKFLRFDSYANA